MRVGSRTRIERFAFGGVAFEMLMRSPAGWFDLGEAEPFCLRSDACPAGVQAICNVTADPDLGADIGRVPDRASWTRRAHRMLVHSPRMRAETRELGPTRYAVTARIEPSVAGLNALLRAVSAALLHAHGGLVLHAAAAELAGRAVLFLGPSGAGKSTAVSLCLGAKAFANDHVCVVPGANGHLAWALPGGNPAPGCRASDARVLPLAAVLDVRRGAPTTTIGLLHAAEARFAVRRAVETGDSSLVGEERCLDAVGALLSGVPVARVSTVLGQSPAAAIERLFVRPGAGGTA